MQAKKCKVRKVWGSQNGDFIDIKLTWFVSRGTDLSQTESAIGFLPVSLDPGERYSCCANKSSSTKWTKFSECKDFLQLQTGENRRKNTPSLLKIQGIGLSVLWPFVLCGFFSTVRLLSRNRISSQWTRHYCFWQPLFLVFPVYFARYTDPNVPQPNLFSFSKSLHLNFGNSGSFFAFLFRLVGI